MSEEISWPPTSPRAALLSSPGGRKRYSEAMDRSPMKRSRTTPNLLGRLQEAKNDGGQDENVFTIDEADEDDEETLKLQLAAIEAKLKLKKLQQAKARPESSLQSRSHSTMAGSQRTEVVQVGLSPVRRTQSTKEPRSPSRVLLGIDKGKTGADVSLKRAQSISTRSNATALNSRPERPWSRASQVSSRLHGASSAPKSFSERMAEVRDKDKGIEIKRKTAQDERSSSFNVDKDEMESYRAMAEENRKTMPPPSRIAAGESFTRDEILQAKANAANGGRLKRSKTMPDLNGGRSSSRESSPSSADPALHEAFSGISLSNRILPHTFLQRTLPSDQFTIYTVAGLLRDVTAPDYEVPMSVTDHVVFAIIASKSSPLDQKNKSDDKSSGNNDWEKKWDDGSQNQRKFIALTLTDLKWTVDLYLFGTAVPRYHRLTPGTVIAILNPGIMPPKKGKEDTGAFSLSLNSGDDTILEIGTSSRLGWCEAKKKDGGDCKSWVDLGKTGICEWHLNMQLYRAEQSRMGVNAGSHGYGRGGRKGNADNRVSNFGAKSEYQMRREASTFDHRPTGMRAVQGKGGLLPNQQGQRFDWMGQSYYVSKSTAPQPKPASNGHANPFSSINTARTLDLDDPFLNADHVRDRKAVLKRKQEREKQERVIAERLGKGEGGTGGAGAEYMRHRSGTAVQKNTDLPESSGRITAAMIKGSIMRDGASNGPAGSKKRSGEDVRLGPVKKTRFVTDRGIKEAGRESIGVVAAAEEEDDDDLDIV